ncbi:MAG: aspartate/glutamate racemase family protein [Thermomicrobiales bacterium]
MKIKRMGVLGGIGPQATIDFEARVHAVAQRVIPQQWNGGYPPMVVWYHRDLPIHMNDDGMPVSPVQADPRLLEAAAQLGRWADFLAIPCNSAHVAQREIAEAAGCPLLSMVDVTLHEVTRREWTKVGVLGFGGAPRVYVDPLEKEGIVCATIDRALQSTLDAAIRAVMEGRNGAAERDVARAAISAVRAQGVGGTIMGCTEIPLLLGSEGDADDLLNPIALLAEAAVCYAIAEE